MLELTPEAAVEAEELPRVPETELLGATELEIPGVDETALVEAIELEPLDTVEKVELLTTVPPTMPVPLLEELALTLETGTLLRMVETVPSGVLDDSDGATEPLMEATDEMVELSDGKTDGDTDALEIVSTLDEGATVEEDGVGASVEDEGASVVEGVGTSVDDERVGVTTSVEDDNSGVGVGVDSTEEVVTTTPQVTS